MTHKNIRHLLCVAAAGSLIAILGVGAYSMRKPLQIVDSTSTEHIAAQLVSNGDTQMAALAERLARRLDHRGMQHPGVLALMGALQKRKALLDRTVAVTVQSDVATDSGVTVAIGIRQHTDWLRYEGGYWSASFVVDAASVQAALENAAIPQLRLAHDSDVLSIAPDAKEVLRATTTQIAKAGFGIDAAAAGRRIADALQENAEHISIEGAFRQPTVQIHSADGQTKTLTLLATGLSDFSNSTPGRLHNVHKAIEERVNNVYVKAGDTFSLVAALDAPITLDKGWMEDLGLFGGGAALTPGAGICQSATTLYRAVLLAGLPVVEKRNHSLFVDHYEFYGIGLDATVFPGFHDVRFTNDTGDDILIQASTEGTKVTLHIFGHDDGRKAHLDGPYFVGAKNRPSTLRALGYNEIGWVRTVTHADGSKDVLPLIATYAKPVWKYMVTRYAGSDGEALLSGLRLDPAGMGAQAVH